MDLIHRYLLCLRAQHRQPPGLEVHAMTKVIGRRCAVATICLTIQDELETESAAWEETRNALEAAVH